MLTVTCRDIWKFVITLYMAEVLTDYPIYTYWMQYFTRVYDNEVWGVMSDFCSV